MTQNKVKCSNFEIANDKPFTLIAGPCQLENEKHAIEMSTKLKTITGELGLNFIYKTSFDKANRTSIKGKRGLGLEKSLPIFDKIKKELSVFFYDFFNNFFDFMIFVDFFDKIKGFVNRYLTFLMK